MTTKNTNLYGKPFGNHFLLIAISLCLIFIFMGILAGKIHREIGEAEQAQFEYRLTELKAAVRLMEAALRSQDELELAYKFNGANPMDWLDDKTTHYLGEMKPIEAIEHPGKWFFDIAEKEIAYVPHDLKVEGKEENKYESVEKILRFKVLALRSKEMNSKYNGLVLQKIENQNVKLYR